MPAEAALYVESGKTIVHTNVGGVEQDFEISDHVATPVPVVTRRVTEAIATTSLTAPRFAHDAFQKAKAMIKMQQEGIVAMAERLEVAYPDLKQSIPRPSDDQENVSPHGENTQEFAVFEAFTQWAQKHRNDVRELNLSCDPDSDKTPKLHVLPPQVGLLSSLTTLSLSGNYFLTLPPELGTLPKLEMLNLAYNPLHCLPGPLFLPALTELNLDNTELHVLPAELEHLPNLKMLSFRNNYLKKPAKVKDGVTFDDTGTTVQQGGDENMGPGDF